MKSLSKFRIGAIVAVAVAAFLVALLLLGRGEESAQVAAPTAASVADLQQLAAASDTPMYWAGPLAQSKYEATRTPTGNAYVRYLPAGVQIGDRRPNYLTVATYPQADGFRAITSSAKTRGTVKRELSNGGLAVYNRRRPTSVFFSYPRARYQVEVYDPSPGRALDLVVSEKVAPVR